MAKRVTRKLTDIIADVKLELATHYGITDKDLARFRQIVDNNNLDYPKGTAFVDIDALWVDYEVQRDVIIKHVIDIMRKYDPRLCSPASACRITSSKTPDRVLIYDGQHRTVATALLGFTQVPAYVVETDDPSFPSYAFESLNQSGVKKLLPSDLHRNALTRFKLGSTEEKNVRARTLQDQFDKNNIDLEDKTTRRSKHRGHNDYYFSHFKYAYKGIELDHKGGILYDILNAIKTVFPMQEEIDQGVFIGLYELSRQGQLLDLPDNWMVEVLTLVKKTFNSSSLVHSKAKTQWAFVNPGSSWSAPSAMSNFIREVYLMNGGTINLPYHGEGAKMHVADAPAPGLIPQKVA